MKVIRNIILIYVVFVIICIDTSCDLKNNNYDTNISNINSANNEFEKSVKSEVEENNVSKEKAVFTDGMKVREILSCQYDDISGFYDNLALVEKDNEQHPYGYVNTEGKLVIPFQYDFARDFSSGLAYVEKDGMCGYIDKNGKEVIKFISNDFFGEDLHYGEDFSEGLVKICLYDNGWKLGYMDTNGKIVIGCQFDVAYSFHNGTAVVNKKGRYMLIDKTGKEVCDISQYDSVDDYISGLYVVHISNKEGLMDSTGNEVAECLYDRICTEIDDSGKTVFNDTIVVYNNGKYGVIDRNGNEIISCRYTQCNSFKDEMSLVATPRPDAKGPYYDTGDLLYGYVDIDGNEVIPCQYYLARDFSEGLAWVKKEFRTNFEAIDKKGNIVFLKDYYSVQPFFSGVAVVQMQNDYCFVDKAGEIVYSTVFETKNLSEGIACVYDGWKYNLIDTKGNTILDTKYDEIECFKNGYAKIISNGKCGLLTYLKQ